MGMTFLTGASASASALKGNFIVPLYLFLYLLGQVTMVAFKD